MYSLRYMHAKAYMTYFDYDNGIKYYKMAWDLDHSQYNVLYMIARAYGLNKDHKNEEKYLRMFVDKVNPKSVIRDWSVVVLIVIY